MEKDRRLKEKPAIKPVLGRVAVGGRLHHGQAEMWSRQQCSQVFGHSQGKYAPKPTGPDEHAGAISTNLPKGFGWYSRGRRRCSEEVDSVLPETETTGGSERKKKPREEEGERAGRGGGLLHGTDQGGSDDIAGSKRFIAKGNCRSS